MHCRSRFSVGLERPAVALALLLPVFVHAAEPSAELGTVTVSAPMISGAAPV